MTDTAAPCPYCGLTDHTGREHFQFVMSLSAPKDGDDDEELALRRILHGRCDVTESARSPIELDLADTTSVVVTDHHSYVEGTTK